MAQAIWFRVDRDVYALIHPYRVNITFVTDRNPSISLLRPLSVVLCTAQCYYPTTPNTIRLVRERSNLCEKVSERSIEMTSESSSAAPSAALQRQQIEERQRKLDEERDQRIVEKFAALFQKQDNSMNERISAAVQTAVANSVTQAVDASLNKVTASWQKDLESGLESLKQDLATIRKRDNEELDQRLSTMENSIKQLQKTTASSAAATAAASQAATASSEPYDPRKRRLSSSTPPVRQPIPAASPRDTPLGNTPAGVPRGKADPTKVWSSMFPRPLTAKQFQSYADKVLLSVPTAISRNAVVKAQNLNKNFFIQFGDQDSAKAFVDHMRNNPIPWVDTRAKDMNDNLINIYFKLDRSWPERMIGQVMGSIFALAKAKIQETAPTRFSAITFDVNIAKGVVFAVEDEEIFPLATVNYIGDKTFEIHPNAESLAHFGIDATAAAALITAARNSMAAKQIIC